MIDINLIRNNPDLVKDNIKKKFQEEKIKLVDDILKLDNNWRKLKFEEDNFRAQRNKISQEINNLIKENKREKIEPLRKQAKEIPEKIKAIQEKRTELELNIKKILYQIPNIIHSSVPIGKDSSENIEIQKFGKIKEYNFELKVM